MTEWLSRGESEGYAALARAKAMGHDMVLDERWPVVGTRWACRCGAWVAMGTTMWNESVAEISPEVDKPCPARELRNTGPHTVQDDIDELFGRSREP